MYICMYVQRDTRYRHYTILSMYVRVLQSLLEKLVSTHKEKGSLTLHNF